MKNINIYNRLGLLLIIIGILNSCTDVIDVDVPNGGPRLVVDASLNWQKGTLGETQTINLRESTAFFDNNPDVPVTGASVTVTKENDGSLFVFADQNNGSYTALDFVPELNASYTLEILYNGNSYTATEALIAAPIIDRVEQTIEEGDDIEIQLQVFFDDPVDVENYYLGEFTPSNLPLPSLSVISDEFTDGNENFIENDNENYVAGVTVVDINVYGISQRYYDYLNILIQQSGSDEGGPFPTTPVQLKGNVTNVNDPKEEVLGYFRVCEFDTTSYTIN